MKNEKINAMLKEITDTRAAKYSEEIERQKKLIEENLISFLSNKKADAEKLEKVTYACSQKQTIHYTFELDAKILPEVESWIAEQFGVLVSRDKRTVVCGDFEV